MSTNSSNATPDRDPRCQVCGASIVAGYECEPCYWKRKEAQGGALDGHVQACDAAPAIFRCDVCDEASHEPYIGGTPLEPLCYCHNCALRLKRLASEVVPGGRRSDWFDGPQHPMLMMTTEAGQRVPGNWRQDLADILAAHEVCYGDWWDRSTGDSASGFWAQLIVRRIQGNDGRSAA